MNSKKLYFNHLYLFLIWLLSIWIIPGQAQNNSTLPTPGNCTNFEIELIKFEEDVPILWDVNKPFPLIDDDVSKDAHWHNTKRNEPNTLGYHTRQSKPVAHLMGKPLKMKVVFRVDKKIRSIKVRLIPKTTEGDQTKYTSSDGRGIEVDVPCFAGRCPGEYYKQQEVVIEKTPNNLDINTVNFNWELVSNDKNLSAKNSFITSHRIYSLFAKPVKPLEAPPATLLEMALTACIHNNNILNNRKSLLRAIYQSLNQDYLSQIEKSKFKIINITNDRLPPYEYSECRVMTEGVAPYPGGVDRTVKKRFSLPTYLKEMQEENVAIMQCNDRASLVMCYASAFGIQNIKLAHIYSKGYIPMNVDGEQQIAEAYVLYVRNPPSGWQFHCITVDELENLTVYDPMFPNLPESIKLPQYIQAIFRAPLPGEYGFGFGDPQYKVILGFEIKNEMMPAFACTRADVPSALKENEVTTFSIKVNGVEDISLLRHNWSANDGCDGSSIRYSYQPDAINKIATFTIMPRSGGNCTSLTLHLDTDADNITEKYDFKIIRSDGSASRIGDITVDPLPIKDVFEVNFQSIESTKAEIQLHDCIGKMVLSKQQILKSGSNHISLSASNLATGFYYLSVITDKTIIGTKRIIVVK